MKTYVKMFESFNSITKIDISSIDLDYSPRVFQPLYVILDDELPNSIQIGDVHPETEGEEVCFTGPTREIQAFANLYNIKGVYHHSPININFNDVLESENLKKLLNSCFIVYDEETKLEQGILSLRIPSWAVLHEGQKSTSNSTILTIKVRINGMITSNYGNGDREDGPTDKKLITSAQGYIDLFKGKILDYIKEYLENNKFSLYSQEDFNVLKTDHNMEKAMKSLW